MARVDLRVTEPLWVPNPGERDDFPRVNGSAVYSTYLYPPTIINVREEDVGVHYVHQTERVLSTPANYAPAVAEGAKPTPKPAQPSTRIAVAEPGAEPNVTPAARLTLSEEPAEDAEGEATEGEDGAPPKRRYTRKG